MRAAAHIAIAGIGVATVTAAIKSRNPDVRLPDPWLAGVVAALAARLPDIIEPADHPHHRQFFHSLIFAVFGAGGWMRIYNWHPQSPVQALIRDILLSVGMGYGAHLLADATTARGLPLIGKFS